MTDNVRADRGARAFSAGRIAESVAGLFLRLKGYRIRAMRFKTPVGEIDIIAEKGGSLIFAEVKWRPRYGDAAEAITPRQRQRVSRAASWYLARHGGAAAPARFDAVLVVPWRLPVHIKNAWQDNG